MGEVWLFEEMDLSRSVAVKFIADPDADVRRTAALVLSRHPAPEALRPLLELRHAVPKEDTHLLHVVRMALRDQLRADATWAALPLGQWTERDARAVADVALGVPSAPAGAYLLQHIRHVPGGGPRLVDCVHHIVPPD